MANIICDTNIWYGIAGGSISEEIVQDKMLAMHWLSLGEFLFTNRKYTNPEFLKNALISTINGKRKLYHYPPSDHIAYLIDNRNIIEPNMQAVLAALIIQLNGPILFPELDINFQNREKYFKGLKNIVQQTNSNSIILKAKITNKKSFRKVDNTLTIRNYIAEQINLASKKNILDVNTFNWNLLELYEGALKYQAKSLVIGETILTENDLVDIFQLIYVQPGHLFWTKDKGLKRIIKGAGLEHYLFEK